MNTRPTPEQCSRAAKEMGIRAIRRAVAELSIASAALEEANSPEVGAVDILLDAAAEVYKRLDR